MVDISIVAGDEVDKLLDSEPEAKLFWISRLDCFKVFPDVVAKYRDLKRRSADHPVRMAEAAARGSHYEDNYKLMLSKRALAQKELRNIAEYAKVEKVYFVKEDDLPDCEILREYLTVLINNGRYK